MTISALLAVAPTPFVTLQDAGRRGWQRFGVSRSGAMDVEALAAANMLVGNPSDTAALEFAHAGGVFRLQATSCRIAIGGGHFAAFVDDRPIPAYTTATLLRGQTLRVGGARDAVWGYIAVSGGFEAAMQLGSHSTHARSGIGGFMGRAVQEGDELPLASDWVQAAPERKLTSFPDRRGPVRVVMGPQQDFFTDEAIGLFLAADYQVTNQMDRLGYRLEGPALAHTDDYNIISDGLVAGCIQVPGSRAPIVLMRDAQPPGGYPKIATVISVDFGRLAQMRPGMHLRFKAVSVEHAHVLRQIQLAGTAATRAGIVEAAATG